MFISWLVTTGPLGLLIPPAIAAAVYPGALIYVVLRNSGVGALRWAPKALGVAVALSTVGGLVWFGGP